MKRQSISRNGGGVFILCLLSFIAVPTFATEASSASEKDTKAMQSDATEKENNPKSLQQLELEQLKAELEEIKQSEALKAVLDIDVELIQRALNALGFRAGETNNELGPPTRAAIRRFQYSTVARDNTMSEEEKKR